MEETQASVAAVVAEAPQQTDMILVLVETVVMDVSVFGHGKIRR